jgi:hypothetical protein
MMSSALEAPFIAIFLLFSERSLQKCLLARICFGYRSRSSSSQAKRNYLFSLSGVHWIRDVGYATRSYFARFLATFFFFIKVESGGIFCVISEVITLGGSFTSVVAD